MKAIKYFANVLPNGYLPIPEDVKKELDIQKGEKLEVILSYITIKNRAEEIKSLQEKIQKDAGKKGRGRISAKRIDQFIRQLRQSLRQS